MPRSGSTYLPLLLLGLYVRAADTWHATWPTETFQCQNVQVSITGGTPPWDFVIVPVNQQPLFWSFYSPGYPVNASYPATATIPLQLEAGTPYSVAVADAVDWNRALFNPTTVQVVQPSNDSSCFASAQPAHKDFSFQVYGKAAECERQMGITWTTNVGIGPYTFTVVPMDGSYTPWNVLAANAGTVTSDVLWQTNMTAGTRFTIYMNDGYGGGRGGAGEIWEVAAGDNPSDNCVTAEYNGRGTWPSQVTVAAIQASPTPFNSTQTTSGSAPASSDGGVTGSVSQSQSASTAPGNNGNGSSSSGGGLSKGAIAGIAVGAAAGVAILICLIWLLVVRRRKRAKQAEIANGVVDLAEGGAEREPKIEPYRGEANGMPIPVPTGQRYSSYSVTQSQSAHELRHDQPGSPGLGAGAGAAGVAAEAVGVAGVGAAQARDRTSSSSPLTQNSKGYEAFHALNSSPTDANSPVSPRTGESHGLPPGAQRPHSPSDSAAGTFGPVAGVAASVSGSSDSQRESKRPLPPLPPSGHSGEDRSLPTIPRPDPSGAGPVREDSGLSEGSNPEFRRHTDAGEYNDGGERQVVDLPPLYTDVPRRQGQSQG